MSIGEVHLAGDETWPVARLVGEVDLSNVQAMHARLEGVVSNRARGLVVDLSQVTYLDSTGLRLLFRLARQLGDRQQVLRLVLPEGSPIDRVLAIGGIASVAELLRHPSEHRDRDEERP